MRPEDHINWLHHFENMLALEQYAYNHDDGKNYDAIEKNKNEIGFKFKAHFHWQDKSAGTGFCCLSKWSVLISSYSYI